MPIPDGALSPWPWSISESGLSGGEAIRCIREKPWQQLKGKNVYTGQLPVYGQVYHLRAAGEIDGEHWVCLKEIPDCRFTSRDWAAQFPTVNGQRNA